MRRSPWAQALFIVPTDKVRRHVLAERAAERAQGHLSNREVTIPCTIEYDKNWGVIARMKDGNVPLLLLRRGLGGAWFTTAGGALQYLKEDSHRVLVNHLDEEVQDLRVWAVEEALTTLTSVQPDAPCFPTQEEVSQASEQQDPTAEKGKVEQEPEKWAVCPISPCPCRMKATSAAGTILRVRPARAGEGKAEGTLIEMPPAKEGSGERVGYVSSGHPPLRKVRMDGNRWLSVEPADNMIPTTMSLCKLLDHMAEVAPDVLVLVPEEAMKRQWEPEDEDLTTFCEGLKMLAPEVWASVHTMPDLEAPSDLGATPDQERQNPTPEGTQEGTEGHGGDQPPVPGAEAPEPTGSDTMEESNTLLGSIGSEAARKFLLNRPNVLGKVIMPEVIGETDRDVLKRCLPLSFDWTRIAYRTRLSSFEDSWSGQLQPYPRQLAAAGFYYTGKGDTTKTVCCGLTVSGWAKKDEPWEMHEYFSPTCKWHDLQDLVTRWKVKDVPNTQPVWEYFHPPTIPVCTAPLGGVRSFEEIPECGCQARCAPGCQPNTIRMLTDSGRTCVSEWDHAGTHEDRVRHVFGRFSVGRVPKGEFDEYMPHLYNKDMAPFERRMATLEQLQDPESPEDDSLRLMAQAGFYYLAEEGRTEAFCCGLNIKGWGEGQDLWVAHARGSPFCTLAKIACLAVDEFTPGNRPCKNPANVHLDQWTARDGHRLGASARAGLWIEGAIEPGSFKPA
jgi:hypothetical protein